jgi:glycosyltransferase involved in cell wall biosynthesis
MKILHINISDRVGGAAIAAYRLHSAMRSAGIDSKYFAFNRTINDDEQIITVSKYDYYVKRLMNVVFDNLLSKGIRKRTGVFSSFIFGINMAKYRATVDTADIIYLHWICGQFVNYSSLEWILKTGKSVFWFMHDMFPITGGCHCAYECEEYKKDCKHCPCSNKYSVALKQYKKRGKLYKKYDNLRFIAPSKWLFDCAKKSGLTKDKTIYHIPNLLDDTLFKPLDKTLARQVLSLGSAKKIIGFGADSALTNPYKGWRYLRDALCIIADDNTVKAFDIEIVIFGTSYNKEMTAYIPFKSHFLGTLRDEYSLTILYNSLDVFVIPSLADNFPNTILESLACNVPVVGFNIGGIPETVNEHTGYLAEYKNSEDLAKGIAFVLRNRYENINRYTKSYLPGVMLTRHKEIWNKI